MILAILKISSQPALMDCRGVVLRVNAYPLGMTVTALKVLTANPISLAIWESVRILRKLENPASIVMSAEDKPPASLTMPDQFQEYARNT